MWLQNVAYLFSPVGTAVQAVLREVEVLRRVLAERAPGREQAERHEQRHHDQRDDAQRQLTLCCSRRACSASASVSGTSDG